MWVSGCVTALATWVSGPSALASRGHGVVDVVGPVAPPGRESGRGGASASGRGGAKECTQIGENDLSAPFWAICVHCCAVVGRRGDAGVYTDRRKWPLGAVLGHLCTLLRRELRRVARVAPPLGWRLPKASTHTNPRGVRLHVQEVWLRVCATHWQTSRQQRLRLSCAGP